MIAHPTGRALIADPASYIGGFWKSNMTSDQEVIELLCQLASIDSVNPSLVEGGAGEREIAEFIGRWARHAGLTAEILTEVPERPSVVVTSPRPSPARTLLLCGHLDTVGVGAMTDPFGARVDGDRMYGRGVYDMKAGLAAALVACRDAADQGVAGVIVAGVADEEDSSLGVREVLRHTRPDAAVVTEPTELMVATAHKGFVWIEIEVAGTAAHGSRPELGMDAILKIGPVLTAIDQLNQGLQGRRHPTLGSGNVHGSMIRGGIEASTIPDQCLLTIERRTLPGETLCDIEAEIEALLDDCRASDPGLVATSRTVLARDAFESEDSQGLVNALADGIESALGHTAQCGAVSYWADSAFISQAGVPTVLFGPAGDGAHADNEWVSIASTVACARVLTTAARQFCL